MKVVISMEEIYQKRRGKKKPKLDETQTNSTAGAKYNRMHIRTMGSDHTGKM